MKIAMVGSEGSIGTRRKGILQELGHTVAGFDVKLGNVFDKKAVKEFDAAFICLPPNQCVKAASDCADAKVPFFLEKPGAVNYREFLTVTGKAEKSNVINMVACNLRFTTEYRAIEDALPNVGKPLFTFAEFGYFLPFWRPGEYRTYYSCYRMAGGGILMDSIHELDYMFSLFGYPEKPVVTVVTSENSKELADLDAEDNANVYLLYKSGLNMFIHMDYLQRSYKRIFSCVGTKGRIDQTFNVQGSNAMYRDEMKHFLDCVKKGTETIKDVTSHARLLEFIDKSRQRSKVEEDEESPE